MMLIPWRKETSPLYSNSITASHYALDSHAVHKREKGKIALDGFFNYQASVYTVPFGVILPKKSIIC